MQFYSGNFNVLQIRKRNYKDFLSSVQLYKQFVSEQLYNLLLFDFKNRSNTHTSLLISSPLNGSFDTLIYNQFPKAMYLHYTFIEYLQGFKVFYWKMGKKEYYFRIGKGWLGLYKNIVV